MHGEKERKKQIKGTIMTLLGASFWGLCAVAGKFVTGEKGVDPVWMVTLRLIIAGSVMLVIAKLLEIRRAESGGIFEVWKDRRSVGRLLVIAVFAFAICQTTYFAAIKMSNAGVSTAIQQTAPVFVLIWVLLSERRAPRLQELIVLAVVVVGAFVLATSGDIHMLVIPAAALICALVSSITCAMYTLLPGKLIERYGTFETIGWGMLLAGIVLVPVAKLWIVSGTWDIGTVAGFGFVVLFGTIAAFALYLYGVTIVGPVRGSIYGLLEPVVATLASALWLRQPFTLADYIGIALILGGVAALSLIKDR